MGVGGMGVRGYMAADSGASKGALGPFCYENWKAAAAGAPSQGALEYPLFSDSQITGPSAPSATGAPAMKKSLAKVYGYRSDALHGGIPFPPPMCAVPHQHDGLAAETPGTAYSALGAVWTKKDLPMFLHTFEYIVRGALLKWWQSMIGQDGQPPVDEADHE